MLLIKFETNWSLGEISLFSKSQFIVTLFKHNTKSDIFCLFAWVNLLKLYISEITDGLGWKWFFSSETKVV